MKGIIISIEGTDGSGKHTQQQLLANDLREKGYATCDFSFPNYDSPSSAPVKMYLAGEIGNDPSCLNAYQASILYAVDRMCSFKKTIKPHYDNGEIVLFDRYVQSNYIHQCSKIDGLDEKQKFIEWEESFEYGLCELPKPDLIFFIEMPVEKSLELAHARAEYKNQEAKDIHEEDANYMTKSYNNGIYLAKKLGWNIIHCTDENNNLKSIQEIHEEIMKITTDFITNLK